MRVVFKPPFCPVSFFLFKYLFYFRFGIDANTPNILWHFRESAKAAF